MKNKKRILQLESQIDLDLSSKNRVSDNLASKYTQLFELYSSNNDLESIKRALFLQWYAVSEPQNLTSIPEFDKDIQKGNLKKVEKLLYSDEMDIELMSMMKHYYEITDWYFDSLSNIGDLISANHKLESVKNIIDRGCMGNYWASLAQ